jgi:histidine triad (HIT) family protein
VYEDDDVYGFVDISPMAKEHYLFIHKEHTQNVNESSSDQITSVYNAIKLFTQANDLSKDGFRVVTNHGKNGGQTVFHTHFHVLGGEQLKAFGS